MINISAIELDILGALTLQEDPANTKFGTDSRRQNRVPTLDGSAILQDRGHSDSDLTFNITIKDYVQAEFDRLRNFIALQPEVRMTCRRGTFIGTLAALNDEDSKFNFLVLSDD